MDTNPLEYIKYSLHKAYLHHKLSHKKFPLEIFYKIVKFIFSKIRFN